jgi:hypothetical protein
VLRTTLYVFNFFALFSGDLIGIGLPTCFSIFAFYIHRNSVGFSKMALLLARNRRLSCTMLQAKL